MSDNFLSGTSLLLCNENYLMKTVRRWIYRGYVSQEELILFLELQYGTLQQAKLQLGELSKMVDQAGIKHMSRSEAEREIARLNDLLERSGELNLPEVLQVGFADDRDALRAHVKHLAELGLDEMPSGPGAA